MRVCDALKRLRKERGVQQKELANYLQISNSAISHYESGKNLPDAQMLIRIADFFGVSIDYLVGRTTLRLDWKSFQRNVSLPDGTEVTLESIAALFLNLSDESQMEIVKLMKLYRMSDQLRHQRLMQSDSKRKKPAKKDDDVNPEKQAGNTDVSKQSTPK